MTAEYEAFELFEGNWKLSIRNAMIFIPSFSKILIKPGMLSAF